MNKQAKFFLSAGALLAAIAVGLGAFGAHALSDFLERTDSVKTYNTAITYLWYHCFGILITGFLSRYHANRLFTNAGRSFLFGILLFSGSLLGIVFTGTKALGMITPFGGLLFIIGWILLAVGVIKSK